MYKVRLLGVSRPRWFYTNLADLNLFLNETPARRKVVVVDFIPDGL